MKHALVVGGTGMLSGATLWLLDQGYHVSIIARNPDRMHRLIAKANIKNRVTPILVDYKNSDELKEQINSVIKQHGDIDLVMAWIHSYAEEALDVITKEASRNNHQWELFHVLGSSSDIDQMKKKAAVPENCLYHQVQLGFILEGTHSRWLTHQEISAGVVEAMQKREKTHTIGQIEPWERRP